MPRLARHRVQITNTAVCKNDQIPVAMDISDFGEPRLPRPLMRGERFGVKSSRHIIYPHVLRLIQIGIAHQILDSWADRRLLLGSERSKCLDPISGVSLIRSVRIITDRNLRPAAVLLHEHLGRRVETAQVRHALNSLRTRPQLRNDREEENCQNSDDDYDDTDFEDGESEKPARRDVIS